MEVVVPLLSHTLPFRLRPDSIFVTLPSDFVVSLVGVTRNKFTTHFDEEVSNLKLPSETKPEKLPS